MPLRATPIAGIAFAISKMVSLLSLLSGGPPLAKKGVDWSVLNILVSNLPISCVQHFTERSRGHAVPVGVRGPGANHLSTPLYLAASFSPAATVAPFPDLRFGPFG